jgi:hypothetical protein
MLNHAISCRGWFGGVEHSAPGKALRFTIARSRRGGRRRGPLKAERVLHITGVTSVEDRRGDSPQADFTVPLSVNRMGLLVCPKLIAIH